MVIVYGKFSTHSATLEGLTFEDAKKVHPNTRENLLLGAWKIANPKGKMKNDPPKKTEEK